MRVFLNDQILGADAARIDPSDAGLLHGVGLFETLRVYRGVPFRLDRHVGRMLASAAALGLSLRHDGEQIAAAVAAVIEANELSDARLRITVTRGPTGSMRPGEPPAQSVLPTTLLVAATADVGYADEFYRRGLAVAIARTRLNPTDPTAAHKTVAFWPRLLALRDAQADRCGEALWFTLDGRLAEGCVSNVFLVRGGRLLTPPPDTPVLPGVTRQAVLELAAADNIPAEQRALRSEDLQSAEEVFLTNSIMELMPVSTVAGSAVGDGAPGALTRRLSGLYRELVEKETAA